MARSFNGTSDALTSAAIDLTGTNKVSLAFWLWWNSFTNNDDLAFEFSANFVSVNTGFIVDPNESGGGFVIAHKGAAGISNATYARPSAGTWHHYVALFDKSLVTNEVDLYVDGTLAVPTGRTNVDNSDNFGNHPLYFMSRAAASLFGAGRLAEAALFPVRLTGPEALALARGSSPFRLRPELNPCVWPLWGTHSPEIDLSSGNRNLTVTGTTAVAHAPVTPFSRAVWGPAVFELPDAVGQPTMRRWGGTPHMGQGGFRIGRSW